MRSILIVVVLSVTCLALGSVIPASNGQHTPHSTTDDTKKVICYFPDWAGYRLGAGKFVPSNIDASLCTHIVYAFAKLDVTNIAVADTWADIGEHFYQQVLALEYLTKDKKVMISIGGYNDSTEKYSLMIADATSRKAFVDSVLAFCKLYGFSGLNIDWEYPGCPQSNCNQPADKKNFVSLVEELGTALHKEGLLLSVATSANPGIMEYGLDLAGLDPHLDWFTLMTLDYHGQWDHFTGHVAPIYDYPGSGNPTFNLNYTVHYFLDQGIDKTKIVLDMPLYGRTFTLTDPSQHGLGASTTGQGGDPGPYTNVRGTRAYYEICGLVLDKQQWTVVQDSQHRMGPYAYFDNQWISYDDADSLGLKAQYILDNDLAGAMLWDISFDDFDGTCGDGKNPLINVISKKLMG